MTKYIQAKNKIELLKKANLDEYANILNEIHKLTCDILFLASEPDVGEKRKGIIYNICKFSAIIQKMVEENKTSEEEICDWSVHLFDRKRQLDKLDKEKDGEL